MAEDKMQKCKSCVNLDKEKSNSNWTVCRCMPLSVIMSKTSENCEKYGEETNEPAT